MTTLQSSTPPPWSWQRAGLPLLLGYGAAWLVFMLVVSFLFLTTVSYHLWERRADRAWLDIRNIGSALKLNLAKTGSYPTTEEGLRALVDRRIFKEVLRDPWNNEYRYLLWMGCPVVWSYGRDGAPGGEGQDADLSTMGSSPPPWILQRASLSTPLPSPRYCPWNLEQGAQD